MITLRKGQERFHTDAGWLSSWHTFSFGEHYSPAHMGFRSLRVINDDRVDSGRGFPKHPHRDMEIISYVLDGALEHQDSMGNGSIIRPGDVQRMSAGVGVTHSERNPSAAEGAHFLQIWIVPAKSGLVPSYEQKFFSEADKLGCLRIVASPDGRDGSVTVHQDAQLWATLLEPGKEVRHSIAAGRHVYVQVARGNMAISAAGQRLSLTAGDGVALSDESALSLIGDGAPGETAEVLLFDLA